MDIKGFKKLKLWYKYYDASEKVKDEVQKLDLKKYNIHNSGEKLAYFYLHFLRHYNVMKVDKKHLYSINNMLRRFKFQQIIGLKGAPDFFCYKISNKSDKREGEYIFVEVKQKEDGLRGGQFKWLQQNSGINFCLLNVKND